jgi:hypothetical protein
MGVRRCQTAGRPITPGLVQSAVGSLALGSMDLGPFLSIRSCAGAGISGLRGSGACAQRQQAKCGKKHGLHEKNRKRSKNSG